MWLRRRMGLVRRRARCLLLLVTLLSILAVVVVGSFKRESPPSAASPTEREGREAPLHQPPPHPSTRHLLSVGGIHNVSVLQRWCDVSGAGASRQLQQAHQQGDTLLEFVQAPGNPRVRYPMVPTPLCLHRGTVYLSQRSPGALERTLRDLHIRAAPLTDALFSDEGGTESKETVTAVPAVALLVRGDFIANHAMHLIHDVLESLYILLHSFRDGGLLSAPRQTVLFRAHDTDWPSGVGHRRRGGGGSFVSAWDAAKATALSASVLNGFSSAKGGKDDPSLFFTSSLLFEHGEEVDFSSSAKTSAYCFCQGVLVSPAIPTALSGEVYHGIRNTVARQFPNERPYHLHFNSSREEVQDLHKRQTLSGLTYWRNQTSVALARRNETEYRPRSLFIHRSSRRIANPSVYVQMLWDAGFQVEEVHMERLRVDEQFHLGRYADLVVGMHGLGLVHGLWMDPVPSGCRAVFEFLPWVNVAFPVQFRQMFGFYMNMRVHRVAPTDVLFDSRVTDVAKEKARLMSAQNIVSVFRFPSFENQTCVYNHTEVRDEIATIREWLATCLYPS